MTAPQRDRGTEFGRPFSERIVHPIPTVRHLVPVVALCVAIAAIGQAAQGHNADEIVYSVWAVFFVGLAAWFLRNGFAAGLWMVFPIVYAAKLTGDSTDQWWVVVPLAAVMLAGLVLIDRHFYKGSTVSNEDRPHHGPRATSLQ